MSRLKSVPFIVAVACLFLSCLPIVNFLIVAAIYYVFSLIGIDTYNAQPLFLSVVSGLLSITMLFVYYKSEQVWKEIICAFLAICFLNASLFPLALKLLPSIEPPYVLDFILITIVSGVLLIFVGQHKAKAVL